MPERLPSNSTSIPIQRNFDDLNRRLGFKEGEGINLKKAGAKGNGSDDTEAFIAAAKKLPKQGGTLIAPPSEGPYVLSGKWNFDNTRSIRIQGAGGLTAGNAPATQILFKQGGTEAAISARTTAGFCMADCGVFYDNGAMTGPLVDLSHSEVGLDSGYAMFERCQFTGLGVRSALGFNLDRAIITAFRGCNFLNLDVAARGQKEPGSYSNSIRFDACTFAGNETAALKNAGEAWYVSGCTFEPLHSGAASCHAHDASVFSKAMTVTGCWMGDITNAGESKWIDFYGSGLTVTGNLIGGNVGIGANVIGVKVIDAASSGIVVTGNDFEQPKTAVLLGSKVAHYMIGANVYSSVTTKVSLDGGATDSGEGFLSK